MSYAVFSPRETSRIRPLGQTPPMASMRPMRLEDGRRTFRELSAVGISPAEFDQFKLDRLLELRAVIDSLRHDNYSSSLDDRPERGPERP